MRIPNKFNGYSADGRRLYNDPATVVVTIANMGEGVAIAEALAAAAAASTAAAATTATTAAPTATTAATTATTAAPTATTATAAVSPEIAANLAAAGTQQGVMQGLGAGATPFTPAGSSVMTTAGGSPLTTAGGSIPTTAGTNLTTAGTKGFPDFTNPAVTGQPSPPPVDAGLTAGQQNFLNSSTAGGNVMPAETYTGGIGGGQPGPFANPNYKPYVDAAQKAISNPAVQTQPSGIMKGFQQAAEFVGEKVGQAYEAYKKAPMPIQALGAMGAYQKFMGPQQQGPTKYKRTPYSGLSPDFQPSRPSPYLYGFADGGITGPVEQMSRQNAIGANTRYPMASQTTSTYATPAERPVSENIINPPGFEPIDPYTGTLAFSSGGSTDDDDKEEAEQTKMRRQYAQMMKPQYDTPEVSHRTEGFGIMPRSRVQQLSSPGTAANAELAAIMKKYGIKASLPKILDPQGKDTQVAEAASGGVMYGLGGYSDGGRLLRGPGDGVSDSIPAQIGSRQPARLADGEFVIPARIVSELGNGSTEAGARQLYAMMDRVQKSRKKSVGKDKVAVNTKAAKHLPA